MDEHRIARVQRPDGRYALLYASEHPLPQIIDAHPQRSGDAVELRWNPRLGEHVIVSTGRQDRTFLPPLEHCPLCASVPGERVTEIPAARFEIAVFENRFPSFRADAPPVANDAPLERRARAAGACEVIVYTPDHDATLHALSPAQARHLVDVWAHRYEELAARDGIAYVFIFENRGKEIGVTLTHPHGQIYAFPFVPPVAEIERMMSDAHTRSTGSACLACDVLAEELSHGRRIIAEAPGFVAYVPFAARLPYEVHVAATGHRPSLLDLSSPERDALASVLQRVQATYDALWGFPMPYTMSMHQRAPGSAEHPGDHFHVEFAPPYRTKDKLKYLAGVETGAGTFINDTSPEETAGELRDAAARVARG